MIFRRATEPEKFKNQNTFNIIFYLFQLHLEAAHVLQYTEDEFLQTLDWKPFGHHEGQKTN